MPKNQQVKNQTIWTRDNLEVLRGLPDEFVDLIYLDPPFNSNRNYEAPIGSEAAGAAFKDTWTLSDIDNAWHGEIAEKSPAVYEAISTSELTHGKRMKSYLIMMAVRLVEMKRILKPTGSVYLHCDPTASHYLKMLMDAIFGSTNFRNEIIWERTKGAKAQAKQFPRNGDHILFYAMPQSKFHPQYKPLSEGGLAPYRHKDPDGRVYRLDNVSKPDGKGGYYYDLGFGEVPPKGGYRMPERTAREWLDKGMLVIKEGKVPARKRYLDESKGSLVSNVWTDIGNIQSTNKERADYPTQKPLPLLERIIKASSNEGDLVFDPFCGCATALVAAEKLNRQWIGIDISEKAVELVRTRMRKEANLFDRFEPIHRTDIPSRAGATKHYADPDNKKILYGQQEGRCNGCGVLFPYRNLTIDHIVAQNKGGGNEIENLQLLCGACNSTKGTGTQEELIVKLQESGVTKYR